MTGAASGGGGGLGGLGGMNFPIKAGGGMLGLIVLLATLFLPKLLGGRRRLVVGERPPADQSESSGEVDLRDRDRADRVRRRRRRAAVLDDAVPGVVPGPVPTRRHGVLQRLRRHRLRPGVVGDRSVLLPGRQPRVLRSRLPAPTPGAVRSHRRPRRAVHRRPRVRPPRAERARHQRPECTRRSRATRIAPTSTRSRSNCRPTASPVPGPRCVRRRPVRQPAGDRGGAQRRGGRR